MSNRQGKQAKFIGEKKNNMTMYVIAGIIIFGIMGAALFYSQSGENNAFAAYNVGSNVNYTQTVQMTDVGNTVNNGKVALDIEEIKKAGIIYTEYDQNGKKLALTAWVAHTGDIVAAVSMCEPCRGFKFRIEGTALACNACDARWTLDTLQGISGGCLQYPPDALAYEVKDGKLLLDEAEIIAWQPRE